jgi:glycerol-3-phosphate dehydrogenase
MAIIERDVSKAAASTFDLIIVGGGVYGVMLALEAGMRGQRALLLEKEDFGGATSLNHLRTVHGGLRYLQSLDLPRFFESVSERRWFLANFPALVQVLPCLMPLYGRGLKRSSIMGSAMLLNDSLGLARNAGVAPAKRLPRGRLVSRRFIIREYPQVQRQGLRSGALWYDASMPEHQRLLMEILRWACGLGATALNYVQAEGLLLHHDQVRGVAATDRQSGQSHEFRSPIVVNAAGPWCRQLAQKFDRDYPRLFRKRLMLFNVLFRRKALSSHALALTPPSRSKFTYFVHNWKGRLLAGTAEVLLPDDAEIPAPRPDQVAGFIANMNEAVPDLLLSEKDIEHIYAGILPATAAGTLSKRECIIRHRDHEGPIGLFSVSGVKYTTARLVAEKAMRCIFPQARVKRPLAPPAEANSGRAIFAYDWAVPEMGSAAAADIGMLLAEEAVMHLDDLLFRRCGLGENRRRVLELLPQLRPFLPWNDLRWQQECERVKSLLKSQP